MPRVGKQDRFEQTYINRIKSLLAHKGQLLGYESDRAALDLGLHLYESLDGSDPVLGQVRVWFQLKGIRSSTLDVAELTKAEEIAISRLSVEHIQYWASHPEPVYLAVYVEAIDQFFAEDVRDLVERNGGFPWLREIADRQCTTTLRMPLSATLETALHRMPAHRSLRLDGPDFRGRPLGHHLDPLRCELERLAPEGFDKLVQRLLDVHEFRPSREIDLLSKLDRPIGTLRAVTGCLYLTYEWTTPLETEFGVGEDSDFRFEARPHSAQGDVLIIVQADVKGAPRSTDATKQLVAELQSEGIEQALVFFNAPDLEGSLLGGWRTTLEPMARVPQGLGSLAFNVLTATNVYLEFLDGLGWRYLNFR
jgi:hypothetical protein